MIERLKPMPAEGGKEKGDYYDVELRQNGVQIHEEGETYAGSIAFDAFEGKLSFPDLKRVRNVVLACTTYLSLPIVSDNITDHNQRRSWRAMMAEGFGARGAIFTNNRLRVNKISAIIGFGGLLKKSLRDHPKDSPEVAGLSRATDALLDVVGDINAFKARYKSLPSVAPDGEMSKVSEARRISEGARAFLAYLEHPDTGPSAA